MTAGRMQLVCWIVFVVMSVVGPAVIFGGASMDSIPRAGSVALAVAGGLLWWGPFGYAMYLAMYVTRTGDVRLLKRGVRGTAEVLEARATNTTINAGGNEWSGDRVYKYKLRVTLPGQDPYETSTSICASGIQVGDTVDVAAARHNHKRVTFDLGQLGGSPDAHVKRGALSRGVGTERLGNIDELLGTVAQRHAHEAEQGRVEALDKLARMHQAGDLTDDEFAKAKAQIIGS
jgi:hypothetical protein